MPTRRLLLALLGALALLVAACGEDEPAGTTASTAPDTTGGSGTGTTLAAEGADTGFPVVIDSAGGTWTLETAPQRIVSLSPMATEVLFAIGAGDQVVAADEFSTYPADAPATDLSGFDPNVEAIVAYEPDLVVVANDANDVIAGLTSLDVPVLVSEAPIDIDSGYDSMAELGTATGHGDEAAAAVADLRAEVDDALAAAPDTPIRVYHELDEMFYAASSYGFIGSVYAALGAENIADAADADHYGYPQLTEEYIITADPELIVITDQASYTADDVAARPGWDQITAVENGNIAVVDADIASRWGPRLPQFVTAVAEALSSAVPTAS
jgi:cobalamin transport system substrate-binding protein